MQRLEISNSDYQPFLLHRFTHLTHFVLRTPICTSNPKIWQNFLRLNPQIRSFESTILWDRRFLQMISVELPNLEILSIEYVPNCCSYTIGSTNDIIQFKNVKKFSLNLMNFIDVWDMEARIKISAIQFDKLEKYSLTTDITEKADGWIELIGRYRTLTSVETKLFELNRDNLMRLDELLPKLNELTLQCFKNETVIDTKRFLLFGESTVNTVHIQTDSSGRDEFSANVLAKWEVAEEAVNGGIFDMTFVRKMNMWDGLGQDW